jgi:hypothetical protein
VWAVSVVVQGVGAMHTNPKQRRGVIRRRSLHTMTLLYSQ